MKLTPYQKLLTMGKEAVNAAMAPVRARAAHKQAELEVCRLEERIATMEQTVTEACSKNPVDFDRIIHSLDELALAERRKDQFGKIIEEMFPAKS